MTIENWISCIGNTSDIMFFSVRDSEWFTTESVDELIDRFGGREIENVSIEVGDYEAEIHFHVTP